MIVLLKLVNFEEVKIDNLITYCADIEIDNDSALETLENRLDICDIHFDNLSKDDLSHFKIALSNDSENWFVMLACGEHGFITISNDFKFKKKTYKTDLQKMFDDWISFPKTVKDKLGDDIQICEYDTEYQIQIKK